MQQVVIDGRVYVPQDEVNAAARLMLVQMLEGFDAKLTTHHEVVEKLVPQALEPDDMLKRVIEYVRRWSVPTAALLSQKVTIIGTANNVVTYLMAKPFVDLFERQKQKRDLLHQATQTVFGHDYGIAVVHSLPGQQNLFRPIEHNQAQLPKCEIESHDKVLLAWRQMEDEIKAGKRKWYTYAHLREASGLTKSTTYHAAQALAAAGKIDLIHLAHKRK